MSAGEQYASLSGPAVPLTRPPPHRYGSHGIGAAHARRHSRNFGAG
jgi:hypothetical protein